MSTDACRPWREQIGALALGGLDAAERAALEAHLEGCPECREEAESLAHVAALLAKADPARAQSPAPQPSSALGERINQQIGAERRARSRRRRWFATGGTAVAATAATVLALVILPGGGGGEEGRRVLFTGLPEGVKIGARLESEPTGTEIHMYVRGMPSGTLCNVFVRRPNGKLTPAGSFRYVWDEGDDPAYPTLTTAVDVAEMRSIVIRAGDQRFEQPL